MHGESQSYMKIRIKVVENILQGLSFLDNGRNLIPVSNFYSTVLFTKMNQHSENYASSGKKQNSRHNQFPVRLGYVVFIQVFKSNTEL